MIPQTLFITNGDNTVKIMQELNFKGDILPWRDVLHEGEVPLELTFEALCKVRTDFIVGQEWGTKEDVKQHFDHLIKTVDKLHNYKSIELWFEHDLYDQLHILQILDLLADKNIEEVSLICTDNYLGEQSPTSLAKLYHYHQKITSGHYELAKKAWSAFRRDNPLALQALLNEDTSILPFLHSAIERLLQEYPSCDNGLPRSMQRAFEFIAQGVDKPWKVFEAYQRSETARFMGDSSFWAMLESYINTPNALLKSSTKQKLSPPFDKEEKLTLTPLGVEVMNAQKNWWDLGKIDRYIGGVHINKRNSWCYDRKSRKTILL